MCGLEPVESDSDDDADNAVEVEGDERRRREAEADPVLLYGHGPLHPVAPLLKHACEMKDQEYCYKEPKVVEETKTVKKCMVRINIDSQVLSSMLSFQFKTTVKCEEIETKIPKVVCAGAAAPLPAPLPVF